VHYAFVHFHPRDCCLEQRGARRQDACAKPAVLVRSWSAGAKGADVERARDCQWLVVGPARKMVFAGTKKGAIWRRLGGSFQWALSWRLYAPLGDNRQSTIDLRDSLDQRDGDSDGEQGDTILEFFLQMS